ncbi:UDP-glucose:glycoprotein glucosyltransferase 1-like isoform X2 [Homarus americanus]|uniref:UDP-glucose:glycoprotein glucosyltransferase 1-like isoform X2 n=1 Tax=Homarus americanus TaxID=6706 RepID=UPI001C47F5BF|nr:UDP-glucose:glycoprotein glucosyltransferase 1-like isoform X2 [Homarus americanus]
MRESLLSLLWAFCTLLLLTGEVRGQAKVKPVTTHLSAKWTHTPLLLEATEYMREESTASFWSFAEAISQTDPVLYRDGSDKEIFAETLSVAGQFLSASQLRILKLSLSLRAYSPKIEMFSQIARDRGLPSPENCGAAVDVNGEVTCDIETMRQLVEKGTGTKPITYEVDHHYPGGENAKVGVVLYCELGSVEFQQFHQILKELVSAGKIDYILRHRVKNRSSKKVRLSGYGVELAIKSTEYKAQDDTKVQEDEERHEEDEEQEVEVEGFLFSKLESLHPEKEEELNQLRKHLEESRHEMAPMKVWQLQHLSMQAAQRIMSAPQDQQLGLFVHTAQNFPMLARSLVRIKVDEKMKREILKNQNQMSQHMEVNPSDAALFINGMHLDMDFTNIFTLLDHIRSEERVMGGLHKLGVTGESLSTLLQLDVSESTQEYGIDIRDSAIMWMNNIETDKAYRKWPSTIGELLRPTYPGMLRSIKKNLHNLVIVADPVKSTTADLIRLVESFVTHSAPVRVGLVMSVNPEESLRGYDDAGLAMLCAFNYVAENMAGREDSNYKALQFLIEVYSSTQEDVTVTDVTNMFKSKYPSIDLDDVFDEDSDYDVGRMLAQDFVEKAGITNLPQALMNGVPLPEKHLNVDEFEEVVLMEVMRATQSVQRAVYNGELTNSHDVVDWLMALPNIMPRLNERILNTKSSTYIDLTDTSDKLLNGISVEAFSTFKSPEMSAIIANSCHYITTKSEPAVRPLTVWVVGDFDTYEGRDLLLEAVKYLRESNSVRLCAIHNRDTATDTTKIFSRAVEVAQATLSPAVARQFLAKVLAKENARKILDGSKKWTDYEISGLDMEAFQSRLASLKEDVFKIHSLYCRKVLSIAPRIRTVVANGRMLGTLKKDEKFVQEDFGLLEKYVQSTYGEKITEVLDGQGDILPGDISDMLMKVTGVLQTKPLSKGRTTVPLRSEQYSVVKVPPKDPDVPAFDVVVICDPVSTAAQKIGPIIMVLQEVINANIRIVLNSREKHSEMPLTSFYRYVLEPEPQFSEGGELTAGPHARFTGLPESPILTLNYHAPENWLVEVVQSIYDLDNIKLESVEGGVHSEFELEHLLLEGHCFEQSSGNPPRGLQFTLGNIQQPVMVDTIVMANLGYFQLKANPGAWLLRLRQGRSSDIYSIASHEGTDTPTGSEDVQIILSSFKSHVVKVRVAKKPGKQNVQLLSDDNEESGGLWNSITSMPVVGPIIDEWRGLFEECYSLAKSLWLSSSGGVEDEDETVNIFSVASGHLYERFLRIMMVSVLRHTKTPVKFWFVKNFLSPIFKDILPLLAKEYGFEYELVQYKWPRWLHQQTEKQRIIWGYKILFLDVLFPLDIKKIIFVDADQIVRADIKDLNNEDLDGAPYGFVPFCDSRKEIDGFRFWKQGYWRNHLAGRKYHISALFVVDLKKFRRIAAGDRLRGQYQGLSQDPNSLSNLDQDLPNNMVHQVRIKSLPQDWLWCESWCDDESKKTAKIIDLCNNPMTKEAKLEAAQRIIDEWTTYDNEIKTTIQNFKQNKSTQSEDSTSHKPHIEL